MKAALLVLAACSSSPPPPAAPVAARAVVPVVTPIFEPASFGVQVAGSGRDVILIPGLGCPGSVWDETVAHLHARTHVLTLSGFAGRPAIDKPLAATVRGELASYIRDRKLDHPVVIGHSMGGFIALWLAASEPDLVGPVIVADGSPQLGDGNQESARQMRQLWATMSDADLQKSTRDMFSLMATNAQRIEPVIQAVARSDRRALGDAFYELFTTDLRPQMAAIRAPVRMILADGPFQQQIKEAVAAIPSHDVRVLANTRHFVMFDDPAGFFAAVDQFLAAHP
jgi:pimeloyl-ACP methyl ester carboxylesterase